MGDSTAVTLSDGPGCPRSVVVTESCVAVKRIRFCCERSIIKAPAERTGAGLSVRSRPAQARVTDSFDVELARELRSR